MDICILMICMRCAHCFSVLSCPVRLVRPSCSSIRPSVCVLLFVVCLLLFIVCCLFGRRAMLLGRSSRHLTSNPVLMTKRPGAEKNLLEIHLWIVGIAFLFASPSCGYRKCVRCCGVVVVELAWLGVVLDCSFVVVRLPCPVLSVLSIRLVCQSVGRWLRVWPLGVCVRLGCRN